MQGTGDRTHVLWTGGWDSTFRVLQLAVGRKRIVQPHYLIDLWRRSTLQELRAMHRIRLGLARLDQEAAARIEPLVLSVAQEVRTGPGGLEKLARLRERGSLFRQYDFLTAYAATLGGLSLELCFTRDDHRPLAFLDGMVEHVADEGHGYWQLDRGRIDEDYDVSVFLPFRFPLLATAKVEMLAEAEALGVSSLMEATWVCHNPRGRERDTPCGRCAPCTDAIVNGMGHRFPVSTRMRYHLRPVYALARRLRLRYRAVGGKGSSLDAGLPSEEPAGPRRPL